MACDLMGAAVLITLGVLFLLHTWTHISFHYTWPVILIVIGLLKFLQASAPTTGHIPPGAPAAGIPAPPGAPETTKDPSHG
jgi:uncharacterized membrane protein YhhN